MWSYVAGGAGDERTQRANCEAFQRWGLYPRMFVGAAQRNGHKLVVVQMYGTGDMYGQAIGLLDWGFSQYR